LSTGSPKILEFQCPKCEKRLKAGVQFAGKRVRCPQCREPVRVPELVPEPTPEKLPENGIAPIIGVDDWLSLDAPVLEKSVADAADAKPKKPTFVPGTKAAGSSNATRTATNSASSNPGRKEGTDLPGRSVFDDDLPDLAQLESAPNMPHSVADIFQLEGLDDLVPSSQTPPTKQWPLQATPPPVKPVENDYRVNCRTCGTPMFLKLDRVGKKVSCSDCHSSFVVPPPPAGWSPIKKQIELEDDGFDVPLSAPEAAQSANTLDSQRTAASEYLDKARQTIDDEELDSLYQGDFDTIGFMRRTFGFLTDPTAVGQIVLYGFVFAGVFALAQFSKTKVDGGGFEGGGYLLVLFIMTTVISTIMALPMLSAGLALLESVANHQRRVAEWPSFNVFDNFGEVLVILFSLLGSLLPGMLVGGLIGRSGGAEWLILTGMMGTCFLLFPVLMLSMLDNGSPLQPFSGAVITSIPQVPEAWGGYYLKTLVAFSSVVLLWYILLGRNPVMSALAGFTVPWLLFFTCQQIGTLADAIAEHLSFDFSPPEPKKEKDAKEDAREDVGES
jgi:DNA-directed RNA polymerase subunit RPC12/RpoP